MSWWWPTAVREVAEAQKDAAPGPRTMTKAELAASLGELQDYLCQMNGGAPAEAAPFPVGCYVDIGCPVPGPFQVAIEEAMRRAVIPFGVYVKFTWCAPPPALPATSEAGEGRDS